LQDEIVLAGIRDFDRGHRFIQARVEGLPLTVERLESMAGQDAQKLRPHQGDALKQGVKLGLPRRGL
jgi:hypothetical protein